VAEVAEPAVGLIALIAARVRDGKSKGTPEKVEHTEIVMRGVGMSWETFAGPEVETLSVMRGLLVGTVGGRSTVLLREVVVVLGEAPQLSVGVGVGVGVEVGEVLDVGLAVRLGERLVLPVMEGLAPTVREAVGEPESVGFKLAVEEGVGVDVEDGVGVLEGEAPSVKEAVGEALKVELLPESGTEDGVVRGVIEVVREGVSVLGLPPGAGADAPKLRVAVGEALGVGLTEAARTPVVGVGVGVSVGVGENDALAVAPVVVVGEEETVEVGEVVADSVIRGDGGMVGDPEPQTDRVISKGAAVGESIGEEEGMLEMEGPGGMRLEDGDGRGELEADEKPLSLPLALGLLKREVGGEGLADATALPPEEPTGEGEGEGEVVERGEEGLGMAEGGEESVGAALGLPMQRRKTIAPLPPLRSTGARVSNTPPFPTRFPGYPGTFTPPGVA